MTDPILDIENRRKKNIKIEKRICLTLILLGLTFFVIDLALNPNNITSVMISSMIGAVIGIGIYGGLKNE